MAKTKVGTGWSFFWFVLIFGLLLAAFGITLGVGASLRIPATEWNLSLGGSIGKKEVVLQALPGYLSDQIADNNTFFNQSHTITIWVAQGIGIIVLGEQPQAPPIDLTLNFRR